MKKALCLLAIGEKYKKVLEKNISQFRAYAMKCGAELVVIDEPLDKTMKRSLLSQKLLIPSALQEYDKVVFLDLDIVISNDCPSLFELLPEDKGLAAISSPRGTEKFNLHYKISNVDTVINSIDAYFTDRNFPLVEGLESTINGGVLVFNPSKIAELFKDYYFSDHDQGPHQSHEEAPMAYISQNNKLFVLLPENYNRQFFFDMYTPKAKKLFRIKSNILYKVINKMLQKIFKLPYDVLLYKMLLNLRNDLILNEGVYILHFAGKSLPKLYTKELFF